MHNVILQEFRDKKNQKGQGVYQNWSHEEGPQNNMESGVDTPKLQVGEQVREQLSGCSDGLFPPEKRKDWNRLY